MEKLPKDREHYVLDNLNMVHHTLNVYMHIHPNNPNYEDYFQEGVVGLILSAIRFDESKGFKFSTYAFPNISGMIRRYKRDNDHLIRYPRKIKDVIFQVIHYINQGFTPEEIEEITGISTMDILDAMNVNAITSLDQEIRIKNDGNSLTVAETISDPTDLYRELVDQDHIMETIRAVTDKIPNKKWQGIWEEYIYGLFYGETLTQEYFSKKYGISQAHISRKLREFKRMFVKEFNQ